MLATIIEKCHNKGMDTVVEDGKLFVFFDGSLLLEYPIDDTLTMRRVLNDLKEWYG